MNHFQDVQDIGKNHGGEHREYHRVAVTRTTEDNPQYAKNYACGAIDCVYPTQRSDQRRFLEVIVNPLQRTDLSIDELYRA